MPTVVAKKHISHFIGRDIPSSLELLIKGEHDVFFHKDRRQYQLARLLRSGVGLNAAINDCGGDKAYSVVSSMNIIAAKDIKIARNVKHTRDGMTDFELSMIEAAEQLEEAALRTQKPRGDKAIADTCREVANGISSLVQKYSQKQITQAN